MAGYIIVPILQDAESAEKVQLEVVRQAFASFRADDADPMTVFARSTAVLYSEVAATATRVGEEVFRFYGRALAGLPPLDELPAVGQVTVTAQDTNGPYVVPEGLELKGFGPLGEEIGFRTLAEGVIPNGSLTVTLDVEASEDGEDGNGVSGAGDFSEYVSYLVAVEFVGTTSAGRDREPDETYLDRLKLENAIKSPRPILPFHFEVLARRFGAYRALALNGYDPDTDTDDNRAMVGLAMIDEEGEELPTGPAIAATIKAMREIGFEVPYVSPDYTIVDADVTVTAYPGVDEGATEDAVRAAVEGYLSPAQRGLRETTGETREWVNDTKVRLFEIAERAKRVETVHYVDSVLIAEDGDTLDDVDLTLTGRAPLTRPGEVNVTVNPG